MTKLSLESTIKLSSGAFLPALGLGVWRAYGSECEVAVKEALKLGYRHVDSAQLYQNEDEVGRAVKSSGLPRSAVFLTTKYMPPATGVESAQTVYEKIRTSLKIDQVSKLGQEYIDLLLVHAPRSGPEARKNNWEALVKAQKEGWVKDIGVSNFGVKHLQALPAPTPTVNQIELHPWCQQREIVDYCKSKGIVVQAYCPIVKAQPEKLAEPVLVQIGKKHSKEVVQILIRWSLQKGFVPLPKSVNPARIASNADLYDFELDGEDMKAIDGLDKGAAGAIDWNPVTVP